MSLPHSLCFVIIALSHYTISLESSESETEDEQEINMDTDSDIINKPARFHWEQGIVPYFIDTESYDDIIASRVQNAMRTIESASCVVFRKMTNTEKIRGTYLVIKNPNNVRECLHDTLFGEGGKAVLILGYDCMQRRDIIHSLLHVLGFSDEVTHPQRDTFIRIMWQNIQPQYRSLFRIRTDESPHKMLVEYDTMSIMHFHDRAYSFNGGPTIAPAIPGLVINPSDKLSQLDLMKLRLAFGHECNKRKVGNLFQTCHTALKRHHAPSSKSGETDESVENEEPTGSNKTGSSISVEECLK